MQSKGTSTDEHQQLLQLKYKTYQLEQENKDLKQKLHLPDDNDVHRSAPDPPKTVDKSFREQVPVSPDHYKIPIAIRNKMVKAMKYAARIPNLTFHLPDEPERRAEPECAATADADEREIDDYDHHNTDVRR